MTTTGKFRQVGSAYKCRTSDDSALWIKRSAPHKYELIHEFRQAGERTWSVLGTFRTLTDALVDGNALANA
jgi:hypothetical protein